MNPDESSLAYLDRDTARFAKSGCVPYNDSRATEKIGTSGGILLNAGESSFAQAVAD